MIIRYSMFIALFILFILEGTVYQVFAPDFHGSAYQLIPRWMFMLILVAGIHRGRGNGLLYGITFGVLYDIIYSQVLGVYTFGMGLIAYVFSNSIPFFKDNLAVLILTVVVGVGLLEYYIYGMMTLLGKTSLAHETFLSTRFIPTLIMNFLVITVFAFPLRLWFQYLERRMDEMN
ncbi:rod shape-determining protein MreD [Salipaludibacillus keqinensis]|uniref:Rod shape-determining protein MreD n=1 Tax=Salipaludibacillus keqinensis TaxID=2045207 RepID=A0A323TI52_9BACI|nr:rod shape-determining protein MreD [Salipaludibacillus keqinensis]PYZ93624.1 rod shape-determining protein MreD [Salipaludibacillus keqinensis]